MSDPRPTWLASGTDALARIGVVVHPSRNVEGPLGSLRQWAEDRGIGLIELQGAGPLRTGLAAGEAASCDLVVSIGGDGTTLGAIRTAAEAGRMVLGVACGSLGALTAVPGNGLAAALDRVAAGDFRRRAVAALEVSVDRSATRLAYNDLAFVRHGDGQVRVAASVDGALYGQLAGDGCVVSTAQGSSAYTIAAGGPLLDPGLDAIVFTPLPAHGGFVPPLVLPPTARLELDLTVGYGGARLEIDGRGADTETERLEITLRTGAAHIISFPGGESHLTGLRERGIIADSPRIIAEERRR